MNNRTLSKISRIFAVLAVVGIIVASMSACSSSGSNSNADFPAVSGDSGKEPTIAPGTKGREPKETISRVLVEGNGGEVGPNDTVLVNYKGQLWDGKKFDSSWEKGRTPTAFGLNQVVKGWKLGLGGKKIGDRVQIVIPPADGYGSQETGNIPPNSTLVFVVDVIGAANLDDASSLKNAKDLKPGLPAGVSIVGQIGQKPKLTVSKEYQPVNEQKVTVIAEGKGAALGPDDFFAFHFTGEAIGKVPEGNQRSFSTWDANRIEKSQQPVGNNKLFLGQKVGSRILLEAPSSEGSPGQVAIIDIVGRLAAK